MTAELIITICIAVLTGLAIGFFMSRVRTAATLGQQQALIEQQRAQLEQLTQQQQKNESAASAANMQLAEKTTKLAVLQQQLETSSTEKENLKAQTLSEQKKSSQLQQQSSQASEQLASVKAACKASTDKAEEYRQNLKQLKQELDAQRNKTSEVEHQRHHLAEELATLNMSLSEKEKHFKQQLTQLDAQKAILKQEFQNMANDILEAKGKAFNEQNKASLDTLLNPFKQQLNDFKGKVENMQLEGTKQQTEMRTELKQLQAMHQQMTQEAHNLATALQGQKKVQGNWGELVLENVLERSGLQQGKDYQREDSFINAEGKRGRPDVVVYLPQDKHLIIDAKVSLNAYTRYINSENELQRQQALNEHSKAFAERIKELADRDYYKLNGINSPEMVFMFVPIESAFVEAMKADETLFQKAIEQNVLVATPTTLLTSLNIVRQLWRYEDQNKHTAELAKKAEGVFKKLKTFLSSFEGIKKGLETAQDSYVKAENQLVSGRGNLVKQVGDFKQLAPAIKDQLPQYFVDKAELELNPKTINIEDVAENNDSG